MRNVLSRLGVVPALVVAVGALVGAGCGGDGEATVSSLGDFTTEAAVVQALEGTGYDISYRQLARVQGFDAVAGTARSDDGGEVAFSVLISREGEITGDPEGPSGSSPQFPIVPYSEDDATVFGNVVVQTQPQSGYVRGRLKYLGPAMVPSNDENRMSIRIGLAIGRLFAPGVRGQA